MKTIVCTSILAMILIGCSEFNKTVGVQGPKGAPGGNCTVAPVSNGSVILCPDGTSQVIFNGTNGVNGTSCSVDQTSSGAQISCDNGSSATVSNGQDGSDGKDGDKGDTGPQGPAGAPGTAITIVQFCPGSSSNYPSRFPEVGMCINNTVFAVYSKNDGFLTLIPPGAYHSEAVGSSCNFTLLPNCEVQ